MIGAGLWAGLLTGGIIALVCGGVGLPGWIITNRRLEEFRQITQTGPRVTPNVVAVAEEYVDPDDNDDHRKSRFIYAKAPNLNGRPQIYRQLISKTKPDIGIGQEITLALAPHAPTKFAILIPEMAKYTGEHNAHVNIRATGASYPRVNNGSGSSRPPQHGPSYDK